MEVQEDGSEGPRGTRVGVQMKMGAAGGIAVERRGVASCSHSASPKSSAQATTQPAQSVSALSA